MPISARDLPRDVEFSCDLCIVGAGAAGIAAALRLSSRSHDILLVEAGGEEWTEEAQSLYRVVSAGLELDGEAARLRQLGGSTNHWGGRSRPLSADDLEPRPWIEASGWPLSHAELHPYLGEAARLCEIDIPGGIESWDEPTAAHRASFASGPFEPGLWRFSPPTRFAERYMEQLESNPRIRILTEVSLIELVPEGASIGHLRLIGSSGQPVEIRARQVVLACGGIENAHLLLASRRGHPAGLGNEHDMVGRCFMGHPVYEPLHIQMAMDRELPSFLRRWDTSGGGSAEGLLSLAPETRRRLRMTAIDGAFYRSGQFGSPGVRAVRRIWHAAKHGRLSKDLSGDIAAITSDLYGVMAEARSRFGLGDGAGAGYQVSVLVEQAPDPESRITLTDELDALGVPVARLDWRLGEIDRYSVRSYARLLANEVGRLGWGRARLEPWVVDESAEFPKHGNSAHHMGTTRMSDDPRKGVVDRHCKVHGIANLHIAGSSVFPLAGACHPTLNLVALAIRLADRLDTTLRRS